VATNVVGSWNLLEAARRGGVERIVAASTDKACEPSGILGLTKSLMERVLCGPHDGPACTAVRLGGILQSTGSVLDRWAGTRADGFITVTDPEMTRFVLNPDEAVALLLDASDRSSAGEIVAPTLFAYRLGDLAAAYASRYRVQLSIVGPSSGEKSDEKLVSAGEAPWTRREDRLFVITPGRNQAGAGPYSSSDAPRMEANAMLDTMGAERARA
jgi:FlaA1/EpsC-like NDP-sugar epimerase